MHMFNTIHRLVKFFGFGGLRQFLEACKGGCESWGAQWAGESCGCRETGERHTCS